MSMPERRLPTEGGNESADEAMPLVGHLIELRNRLMWAIAAFVVAFGICFYFAEHMYAFLVDPLASLLEERGHGRLIYTGLAEVFFTYLKISLYAALFLSFPIVAGQLWMFVAPGLYRNEKGAFLPFLIATPVLFVAESLSKKRKYAIVLAFAAAALLTPPDIISQIGLALPILLLYEFSILAVRCIEKRRDNADPEPEENG
jgi:sec-independent protein translocase protein TatC